MSRRSVAWTGGIIVAVLVAGGITAGVLQPWRSAAQEEELPEPTTVTAERTTLTSDLVLNGNLSYGSALDLPGRGGTITGLPSAGQEIPVGQSLYEVDGRPVIAVRGERPFWRSLSSGMTGADVQQLEQALADFGFGEDMTVDTEFTSITERAVKAWQKSLGLEQTGVVELGDIVAVDAPAVRVQSVTAALGDAAASSPFTYTSTLLRVVAKLTDGQARELLPDTVVTVTLPDGTELPGRITAIEPGGVPTGKDSETTPPSAVIELDDPAAALGIGLRAVKVAIPTASVDDALVVPVTALLATLDGGYAVDVLRDGETVRVAVEVGLIADARVQIVGGELVEGDVVVVAP